LSLLEIQQTQKQRAEKLAHYSLKVLKEDRKWLIEAINIIAMTGYDFYVPGVGFPRILKTSTEQLLRSLRIPLGYDPCGSTLANFF